MRKPFELQQPLVTYFVREAWDTGSSDHMVSDLDAARRVRTALQEVIAKKAGISVVAARKFTSIYIAARIE